MPFAPALTEPMSFLERRIRRMTEGRPRWYVTRVVGLVAGAGAVLALACEAPRPSAPSAPGVGAQTPSAVVQGPGIASTSYDTAFEHLRERVREVAGDAVRRHTGELVNLWFVESSRGVVIMQGTAPGARDHSITSEQARAMVPGFDTLRAQSIGLLGYGALEAGSPPALWVRLKDPNAPPRDLSAIDQHPEMVTLPWIREALQRYYPDVLHQTEGPPLELWFVSDRQKQVLRTTRVPTPPRGIGFDQIKALFPDLREEQVSGWMVTNRGVVPSLGRLRKNVNVVWVQLRN